MLTDVYAAGEAPIPGISGETVLKEVEQQSGQKVVYIKDREKIAPYLAQYTQPGDLVITMGAGDIYKTSEELVALLQEKKA